jgi:hypothetical protein
LQEKPSLKATLKLGASDERNDVWPWLLVGAYPHADFSQLTMVEVTYKASAAIKISIGVEIDTIEEDGDKIGQVGYEATLAGGAQTQTVRLDLTKFLKPYWPTGYGGGNNLSQVDKGDIAASVAFFHENYGETVEIEVESVKLYGAVLLDDVSTREIKKSDSRQGIRFARNVVSDNGNARIFVELPGKDKAKEIQITVFDVTGNLVFDSRFAGKSEYVEWDLTNSAGRKVANGTYLVVARAKDQSGKTYVYSAKLGVKRSFV